jgi:hypothetical protein
LSKRRIHIKTHTWSWNEQKHVQVSGRGQKPKMTVLAKASSKLLQYSVQDCQQEITALLEWSHKHQSLLLLRKRPHFKTKQ